MDIIIGHSNMDLDCIASIALARRLYPDFVPIKSGTIHPAARHLYNLYETELEFVPAKDLKGEHVSRIVIVDTRSFSRVKEYFTHLGLDGPPADCEITIYDHHPAETNDFPNATIHATTNGAAATILGAELMTRGVALSHAEATIGLAGIYADTGNFTHENVSRDEFLVAAYFVEQGASVRLVTPFLKSLREDLQIEIFHNAIRSLASHTIRGHSVSTFTMELAKQPPGLAAVVERVFDVESPDALFGLFRFSNDGTTLVVARSRKARIQVNDVLAAFGGGGHFKAASAIVREVVPDLEEQLIATIEERILPALTAADIMTSPVEVIEAQWSLVEASMFLESVDHTGAPVVNAEGALIGFLTLRDIVKGRRNDRMQLPVKGFMTQRVVTCSRADTMHDLERLFFQHNIGHLPVVDDEQLAGIVTRSDYLSTLENGPPHRDDTDRQP